MTVNNELGMFIFDAQKVSPIVQDCINIREGFTACNRVNQAALKLSNALDKFNNKIESMMSSKKEW